MSYLVLLVFTSTILVVSVLGFYRYRQVTSRFHPFLFLIWSALLAGAISIAQASLGNIAQASLSVFHLLSTLLILWQFRRWQGFSNIRGMYPLFVCTLLLLWLAALPASPQQERLAFTFQLLRCGAVILLSIHMINRQIVMPDETGRKNPVLLICSGFVFYFSYLLIQQLYDKAPFSLPDLKPIFSAILATLDIFINLAFALAILWMPRKPKFILRS